MDVVTVVEYRQLEAWQAKGLKANGCEIKGLKLFSLVGEDSRFAVCKLYPYISQAQAGCKLAIR